MPRCARRGIRITGPTGVASPQLTPSWIAFSAAPARSALSDVDYRVPAARSGWHVVSIIGAQHDLESYECSCAWCQPQGDEGSIGRCCSHCLGVAFVGSHNARR